MNWGKPTIIVDWNDTPQVLPTPVEDSTQLETEEGEEIEATVEGGEVEAARYHRNKYNLDFEIRTMSGRKKPLADKDGVIKGTGSILVIPEDLESQGIYIPKSVCRNVASYTAADGGRWAYRYKALKNDIGDQCLWGYYEVTGASGKITDVENVPMSDIKKIEFTPVQAEGEAAPEKITIYTAGA